MLEQLKKEVYEATTGKGATVTSEKVAAADITAV